jgi:hypothetical protein
MILILILIINIVYETFGNKFSLFTTMLEFLQFVFSYLYLACRRKRWLNYVANMHALFRLLNLEKNADVNAREKCNGWEIYILLYSHCQSGFSMCVEVWLFTRNSPVLGIESTILSKIKKLLETPRDMHKNIWSRY